MDWLDTLALFRHFSFDTRDLFQFSCKNSIVSSCLEKFDGKKENLAKFVALRQTLMRIGKTKKVNPVTHATRA